MGFLGVRIDEELEEAIKKTGRPASSIARDALRQYLELDRPPLSTEHEYLIKEIERLLDEKLIIIKPPLNIVKHPSEEIATAPQPLLNAVKPGIGQSDQDLLNAALEAILTRFDAGEEPTAAEIAEDLGINARPLGRVMKAAGVPAKNTTRSGITARRYPFSLKKKVEKMLGHK